MAHLWLFLENQWRPVQLNGGGFALLNATPDGLHRHDADAPTPEAGIVFQRHAPDHGPEDWLLLVPPEVSVCVNGYPAALGARALRDKDEIRLAGAAPVYFSTEQLTTVGSFPGPQSVDCPRCSRAIEPGAPAVRCPGCQIWYHQLAERSCFTYAEACTTCGGDTVLSDEFRWTPELL